MAKISEIKFSIKEEQFKINVNCTSGGIFSANIPEIVSEALGIDKKQSAQTLVELEKKIKEAVEKYKNSNTKEELYIFIKYGSYGYYNSRGKSSLGILHNDRRFNLHISFNDSSCLLFDFKVCIKETVDGSVSYYKTTIDKNHRDHTGIESNVNKYYKYEKFLMPPDDWIKIPYSEEAFLNLSNAKEKIRMVSELLFNFVSKDENEISLILNNQKLLG